MSSDMTQLRCQEICLADSKCIGIVYSHHDDIFMEYCYACSNEPHPNFAQSPFGFYRRCDESVCTLPSFDGTGIVGLNEEVGCVSGDSLQDGSSCFTKCDNGYESSDGSNFKEITCTSGNISPLQTCIGTTNPTLVPTSKPSLNPTTNPSSDPTFNPSFNPTAIPSLSPTSKPSFNPTANPSSIPSL